MHFFRVLGLPLHAPLQVPLLWQRPGYPSQLPLGAWLRDFAVRLSHMQGWLHSGQPTAFWLPAFFFPQARIMAGI